MIPNVLNVHEFLIAIEKLQICYGGEPVTDYNTYVYPYRCPIAAVSSNQNISAAFVAK